MGMMDDLQKRLEKFGKDVERSVTGKKKPKGGHTLGGAADSALEHAFDASRPLGMTLTKADDGRAEVTGVAQQGQAESKAVRIGAVVAGLAGAAPPAPQAAWWVAGARAVCVWGLALWGVRAALESWGRGAGPRGRNGMVLGVIAV